MINKAATVRARIPFIFSIVTIELAACPDGSPLRIEKSDCHACYSSVQVEDCRALFSCDWRVRACAYCSARYLQREGPWNYKWMDFPRGILPPDLITCALSIMMKRCLTMMEKFRSHHRTPLPVPDSGSAP